MVNADTYLVAGTKPWNRKVFDEVIARGAGIWHFVGDRAMLTPERVAEIAPRYIFFLHWSWKVPDAIVRNYECICFHMTDLPYGRGGSPLQNLILRGHRHTKLTAFRMEAEIDAGPIYLKEELSLDGSAEEIYTRSSYLAAEMISDIIREQPLPEPQEGSPTIFQRRRPEESRLPRVTSLQALHDFIRMLDAEGYPSAFLDYEGFRFEFRRSQLCEGRIEADVRIRHIRNGE